MTHVRKVVLVGIDGGTWTILDRYREGGFMPHLDRLKATGASGVLRSTAVPITPVAWSSFHTGVNPGKHGVGGFLIPGKREAGRIRSFDYVSSMSLKARTGWEILSDAGKQVAAINVPMSYPPSPVNGVMVSCFMTPNLGASFTHPPGLREQVLARGYSPIISDIASRFADSGSNRAYLRNLRPLADSIRRKTEQALWIQENHEADVAMFHFQETDVVQHFAYRFLDAGSPGFDEGMFQEIGKVFYAALDDALGILSERRDPGTLLMLVSDHGFAGYERIFNLNNFLLQAGMLETKVGGGARRGVLTALRRLDVLNLRRLVPNRGRLSRLKDVAGIDLGRTRFLSLGNGMNPAVGIYALDERESGLNEVVGLLENAVDPKSGGRVISRVWRKEQLFAGPHLALMPDIVIEAEPGYAISDIFHPSRSVIETSADAVRRSGIHHADGIFLMHGAGVRQGAQVRAEIADVFPTVLGCAGVPLADGMDGRVLTELFTPEAGITEGEQHGRGADAAERGTGESLSAEESRQLQEHLKALGYL